MSLCSDRQAKNFYRRESMNKIYHIEPDDTGKRILKKLGIRSCQMAFDLEIDPARLSRILNGWHIPRDKELRARIARYLGTDEAALWPEQLKTNTTGFTTERCPRPLRIEAPPLTKEG